MNYPLRILEAQMHKVVAIPTTERETDEGAQKGDWVWRDERGEKWFWSKDKNVRYAMYDVDVLAEADGIMFLCPACFAKNGGAVGTHSVLVTFANRSVPDEAGSKGFDGKPTRWFAGGTNIDDLVLTPSILLGSNGMPDDGQCHWHGFVGSSGVQPGYAG